MACSHCGRKKETPHFFVIILPNTIKENRLHIPLKFQRKYGATLYNDVFVNLPCGKEWKMGLARDDRHLYLQQGWPEFSRHYDIVIGQMIVFRYKGNSKFKALIFDKTTTEIDYPAPPVPHGEGSKGKEKESPSLSSWRQKRMKTNHGFGETKGESSKKNDKVIKSEEDDGERTRKYDVHGRMKPLQSTEKSEALEKARGFPSDKHFFKKVMQPSYVHGRHPRLKISTIFATNHLIDKLGPKKCGTLKLKVPGGKTWSANFTYCKSKGVVTAKFASGWKAFAQENSLDIGDVCVFVLTNDREVTFDVIIYRKNQNANSPIHEGEETERSSESSYSD
ncbi:B3 domain-containing transcription factor VRN1-like [Humulus lupulus]|uniref:B3 domain-containing transcription factor VRN1-like n=1 Tax=Humulus lupulus TaxID=3486 RepID=UPI002B40FE63|nr:B3 domain-containing transcription factor VRN1-like [Humulus lupulus]